LGRCARKSGSLVGQFASSAALTFHGKMFILGSEQSSDESATLTGLPGFVNFYTLSADGSWDRLGSTSVEGRHVNDRFGASVAIANLGSTGEVIIAVGAPQQNSNLTNGPGEVRVFRLNVSGIWKPVGQRLVGANASDAFGAQVALSIDGKVLAVVESNYYSVNVGYAEIYALNGESQTWVERGEIPGRKWAATSLDISGNGTIVAVGDPNDSIHGSVRVYECSDEGRQPLGQEIDGVDDEMKLDVPSRF
jgi:hypothetical protein